MKQVTSTDYSIQIIILSPKVSQMAPMGDCDGWAVAYTTGNTYIASLLL
jgi:hypothetical protein